MGYSRTIDVQDPSESVDGLSEINLAVERPSLFQEGSELQIEVHQDVQPSAFVLPLEDGFPFKVAGGMTPVTQLLSGNGLRMGHVLWLDGIGLYAVFDKPAPSGRYHVA